MRKSRKKAISLAKYLLVWPALGRGCIRFFLSAAIHREAGARCFPVSRTEVQQFNIQAEGHGSLRQVIMYVYSYRQLPFRNYSLKKEEEEKQRKAKGKIKEIQHGGSFCPYSLMANLGSPVTSIISSSLIFFPVNIM